MLIAQQKRKTNIAEYVLYMWQIEDIIRAYNFDLSLIQSQIISGFKADKATEKVIHDWYESLIDMMRAENTTQKGHLQLIKNAVTLMVDLHVKLFDKPEETAYREKYMLALPNISLYKQKAEVENLHDLEICLNALYGFLLMKLSKKEISEGTTEAISTFSNLLAYLSFKFVQWEAGELEEKTDND